MSEFSLIPGVPEFGFMGIHVKPDNADAEIDRLVDVYDEVSVLWGLEVSSRISHQRAGLITRLRR